MNGMMMFSPGSSTWWNLPSRSTIQAYCCGTTRTPSMTNTATSATMKNGIANGRTSGMAARTKVATTSATILKSMLPPAEREISLKSCGALRRPGLGNLERAAIYCGDVEDLAGLAGRIARDLRVPERVPVLHARLARAPVDPGLEGGRLAEIQRPHAPGHDRLPVSMHPDDAGDGDDRGGDRLPDERAARIPDPRRHQRRDTEHEQVKRAAHQLGDDEDEAGDQPGKGNVHGTKTGGFLCRLCYLKSEISPGRRAASAPGAPRPWTGPARMRPRPSASIRPPARAAARASPRAWGPRRSRSGRSTRAPRNRARAACRGSRRRSPRLRACSRKRRDTRRRSSARRDRKAARRARRGSLSARPRGSRARSSRGPRGN